MSLKAFICWVKMAQRTVLFAIKQVMQELY